jgi:hypothetical protein
MSMRLRLTEERVVRAADQVCPIAYPVTVITGILAVVLHSIPLGIIATIAYVVGAGSAVTAEHAGRVVFLVNRCCERSSQ